MTANRSAEHRLLEQELAAWLGRERALLFSSEYLAAIAAIPALGALTGAVEVAAHAAERFRTAAALSTVCEATAGRLYVTPSVFEADGDVADLDALVSALPARDVVLVDESHAVGVFGSEGAGLARDIDDDRVLILGSLATALGAQGGFVAGPAAFVDLLVNTSPVFRDDAALPPAIVLAARIALVVARKARDRRARVVANARRFKDGLRTLGFSDGSYATGAPIAVLPFTSVADAKAAMARLLERRVYAPAVWLAQSGRHAAAVRFSIRAAHATEHIDLALQAVHDQLAPR
jgi:8-amino-7-oxononanoate synthase